MTHFVWGFLPSEKKKIFLDWYSELGNLHNYKYTNKKNPLVGCNGRNDVMGLYASRVRLNINLSFAYFRFKVKKKL